MTSTSCCRMLHGPRGIGWPHLLRRQHRGFGGAVCSRDLLLDLALGTGTGRLARLSALDRQCTVDFDRRIPLAMFGMCIRPRERRAEVDPGLLRRRQRALVHLLEIDV